MKKTFLVLVVTSLSLAASSQTFDEWFRQKKTQKTYLLQQIAALRVLNGFIEHGYSIAKIGTDSISQSKTADFGLHTDFIRSLQRVSSTVKGYKQIAAIVAYGTKILTQSKRAIKDVRTTKQLTPEEISHCVDVYQFLVSECSKTLDELLAVTTDGERSMREDERIRRINELYQEVQAQYGFCSAFGKSMAMLTRQRLSDQKDINRFKTINGLQ